MTLDQLPPDVLRVVAFLFGLLWGSFLNVVIYRLPRGMSIVRPGSHCPTCGAKVRAYDNLPVISYVALWGRARCCGAKVSPRYLAVELLGGLISLALILTVARDLGPTAPLGRVFASYASQFALALALLAAAFIDASHMYLPDSITIGGTLLGILSTPLRGEAVADSLVGGVIGFLVVYLPFVVLYPRLRGRAGMGLGDAKLLMLAGAWFGYKGAFFVLFAGAIQGVFGAIAILAFRGKIEEPDAVRKDREELERAAADGDQEAAQLLADDPLGSPPVEGWSQARIPFGPFLIVACLEYLFFRRQVGLAWGAWFFSHA